MNSKNLDNLIQTFSENISCECCPLRDDCPVYEAWINSYEDLDTEKCEDKLRDYVGLLPLEREYKISVHWSGVHTYSVLAESKEKAKVKALEMADLFDVKNWESKIEVE